MDCDDCPTKKELEELKAWKEQATWLLIRVYGEGIEIEKLLKD